jgi:hypothetical protein
MARAEEGPQCPSATGLNIGLVPTCADTCARNAVGDRYAQAIHGRRSQSKRQPTSVSAGQTGVVGLAGLAPAPSIRGRRPVTCDSHSPTVTARADQDQELPILCGPSADQHGSYGRRGRVARTCMQGHPRMGTRAPEPQLCRCWSASPSSGRRSCSAWWWPVVSALLNRPGFIGGSGAWVERDPPLLGRRLRTRPGGCGRWARGAAGG